MPGLHRLLDLGARLLAQLDGRLLAVDHEFSILQLDEEPTAGLALQLFERAERRDVRPVVPSERDRGQDLEADAEAAAPDRHHSTGVEHADRALADRDDADGALADRDDAPRYLADRDDARRELSEREDAARELAYREDPRPIGIRGDDLESHSAASERRHADVAERPGPAAGARGVTEEAIREDHRVDDHDQGGAPEHDLGRIRGRCLSIPTAGPEKANEHEGPHHARIVPRIAFRGLPARSPARGFAEIPVCGGTRALR